MKKRFVVLICVLCAVMMACPFFAACDGTPGQTDDKKTYSVVFDQAEMTLVVGETKTLGVTFSGGDTVEIKIQPEDIASYADGKITALKAGNATVTAKIGDKSATMKLIVEARKYSVTIDGTTSKVDAGSYLDKPSDPKKDATTEHEYVFDGWYIAGTETKWDFAKDTVKSDLVLEAKFTENPRMYWVAFGSEFVKGYYGQLLEKPEDPTKPNEGENSYVFDGWYIVGTDTKWDFEKDVVTGKVNLEARFTTIVAQYTYTYEIESEKKTFMGVDCELFDIVDEDITATLIKGEETTPLEVKNGTVSVTAPRGSYKVSFTYKDEQPIVKNLYLQDNGEAKIKFEQKLDLGGKAGELASSASGWTYENDVLTMTSKSFVYIGGRKPTDTVYMEAFVEFNKGVGTMVGFMPAAEHKTLDANANAGKRLVFSYSYANRVYYAESSTMDGAGITAFDAYVDNDFAPVTGSKISVARIGNEYYVFVNDTLFAYYVNDHFDKADFGFCNSNGDDIEIKFSKIAYTDKADAVKAIVEKNGADKGFYKNNNTYLGGPITYPNGTKYDSFPDRWGLTTANSGKFSATTYLYATNQMANVYYQEANFTQENGWVGFLVNTLDGQPCDNKGWYGYGVLGGSLYLHRFATGDHAWKVGDPKGYFGVGGEKTFKMGVARVHDMYYVYINDKLIFNEKVVAYSTANNTKALPADNMSGFGLFRGENHSDEGKKITFTDYYYTTDITEVANKVGGEATVEFDETVSMKQGSLTIKSGSVLFPKMPVTVQFNPPEGKVVKSYSLTRDGKTASLSVSGSSVQFIPAATGKYAVSATFVDAGNATVNVTVKPFERKAGDKMYSLYDMNIDYTKVKVSMLNFTSQREQSFNMSGATGTFKVESGYCKITVEYNGMSFDEYVNLEANGEFDYVGYVSNAYLGGKINNTTGEHKSFDKASPDATKGSNWALVDGRRDTVRVTHYTYAYQNGIIGNKYYVEGTFDSTYTLKVGTNFGGLLVSHGEKDLSGTGDKKFEVTIMGDGIFGTYIPSNWSPANTFALGNYVDAGVVCDPTAVRLGVLRDGIDYYFFVNDVYVSSYTLPEITFAESGFGVVGNESIDLTISNFNYSVNSEFLDALKATVPAKGKIDVYLIAGQSNASGCTNVNIYNALEADPHYLAGYNNIYYMGSAGANYRNKRDFALVRAGLGENNFIQMGPELGMAKGLSDYYNLETGRKAVMIKYAVGGTNLQDIISGLNSSDGNWCPPSWLDKNGRVDSNLSGGLYTKFMKEFEQRWAELKAMGYNPTVKGLYWMQGEADKGNPNGYAKIFKVFASDFRSDITKLSGQDCSKMPIFIGEIAETSGDASNGTVAKNKAFIKMQNEMTTEGNAKYVENTYIIKSGKFPINALNSNGQSYAVGSDPWHWKWQDAIAIGKLVGDSIIQNVLSK